MCQVRVRSVVLYESYFFVLTGADVDGVDTTFCLDVDNGVGAIVLAGYGDNAAGGDCMLAGG